MKSSKIRSICHVVLLCCRFYFESWILYWLLSTFWHRGDLWRSSYGPDRPVGLRRTIGIADNPSNLDGRLKIFSFELILFFQFQLDCILLLDDSHLAHWKYKIFFFSLPSENAYIRLCFVLMAFFFSRKQSHNKIYFE